MYLRRHADQRNTDIFLSSAKYLVAIVIVCLGKKLLSSRRTRKLSSYINEYLIFILLFYWIFLSGCTHLGSSNVVSKLNSDSDIVPIKNWMIIGPFTKVADSIKYQSVGNKLDNYPKWEKFISLSRGIGSLFHENDFKTISYQSRKDYVDIDEALGSKGKYYCYALTDVTSPADQTVALMVGIDNVAKIWLNKKLVLAERAGNITKDEFLVPISLKKGANEILVQIASEGNEAGFQLDLSSTVFASKYKLGKNYFSMSHKYLLKKDTLLSLNIRYPNKVDKQHPAEIAIFNSEDSVIFQRKIVELPVNLLTKNFPEGFYKIKLVTEKDTFTQAYAIGNYRKKVDSLIKHAHLYKLLSLQQINLEAMVHRFNYLDTFGRKNGFDEVLERKISYTAFDLANSISKLRTGRDFLAGNRGLHIRAYPSKIDNVVNNYMVYVPGDVKSSGSLPLVIIVPWVAKQNPFLESWHLAFIDRIEYLRNLADKYHFAIAWPSARVYEKYNLNPIVPASVFETLDAIKTNYQIDTNRIYLYGQCSGGLQAMLMANRFPSVFAAIGVEGPELNYMFDKSEEKFPSTWTTQNSLLGTASNFSCTPLYIASSRNDWHALEPKHLRLLINKIRHEGGQVTFSDLNGATRDFYVKNTPDNYITEKIFSFFSDKKGRCLKTLDLSTYQLKYNTRQWLKINELAEGQKGQILAKISSPHTLQVTTTNVNSFTIDLGMIKAQLKDTVANIIVNDSLKKKIPGADNLFTIQLKKPTIREVLTKTHQLEGPVNDVFSSSFLIVVGTEPNIRNQRFAGPMSKLFVDDWMYNFFGKCRIKSDKDLTWQDIKSFNLVIIGDCSPGTLAFRMQQMLPFKTGPNTLTLNDREFAGRQLNYSFIFPNPLAPANYLLSINSNSGYVLPDQVKDIALKGWYDYEIWDCSNTPSLISHGRFNKYWK
ncbi:PHB depolymerase family esterase [Mucilaginibacter jinjuensis]|uniref:PHB depolymerase family esterase n=1 Tax=Mucilaginibacter jinjuensis TaxID=1176721 RepID=A0ABY7TDK5_9SPHI|nr:PHB depolymerase family esterase [Mucilaginibacter jinjuensis]WCT13778.1 PHB depolymerase family esterase [Mucilaginibacter jinjuensis]